MKKNKNKTKEKAVDIMLNELKAYGIGFYFFAVFMGLPLYIYDKYWEMAIHKWQIYLVSTLVFVGFMLCFQIYEIAKYFKGGGKFKEVFQNRNVTDWFVGIYLLASVVSFLFGMDKKAAWMGASGWYMGIIAQILFCVTYFVFRNVKVSGKLLLGMHGITSAFCCFYGICQRYGKDWMYLYWDMPDEVVRDYISTIGNRTWFSAYLCLAFPVGMYLFWYTKEKWTRRGLGAYLLLVFHCMLVTSSDSIYMAFAAVLWILVLLSVGNPEKIRRLAEILLLWLGSCVIAMAVHMFKPEFPKGLRGISKILLNGKVVIPLLILCIGVWLVLILREKGWEEKKQQKNAKGIVSKSWSADRVKRWQKGLLIFTIGAGIGVVAFVVLNTTGFLQEWFGVTIQNKYLLFNDSWGDQRGHTWKLTVQMFGELPWYRKLIGVGPDSYALYAYSTPEFTQALQQVWGTSIMTNAHNEWLNSLLCYGILGGVAYLAIFLGGAYEALVKADLDKVNPLVPGIGLCVLAYVCHNFFCYQQVCVTPLLFILLGVAVRLRKD